MHQHAGRQACLYVHGECKQQVNEQATIRPIYNLKPRHQDCTRQQNEEECINSLRTRSTVERLSIVQHPARPHQRTTQMQSVRAHTHTHTHMNIETITATPAMNGHQLFYKKHGVTALCFCVGKNN